MEVKNGIAYYDPSRDGEAVFLPKEASWAVFDAPCVNALISRGFCKIESEEGNPWFSLLGGCLIHRETKQLLLAGKGAVLPEKEIKHICDFSFPCYEKRDVLRIPEGVEGIGCDVFRGKIKKVCLPASLKHISEGAFRHSLDIEEIVIGEGNHHFSVEEGCLIAQESKTLLYACGNTVVIPDGVKRIGRLVFLDHRFRKIVIPASVKEIGEQNFFFRDRSRPAPSYIRATHAKIFVPACSYAEKFFCERGGAYDLITLPHSWKLL